MHHRISAGNAPDEKSELSSMFALKIVMPPPVEPLRAKMISDWEYRFLPIATNMPAAEFPLINNITSVHLLQSCTPGKLIAMRLGSFHTCWHSDLFLLHQMIWYSQRIIYLQAVWDFFLAFTVPPLPVDDNSMLHFYN
jgi:hypothetical protein